MALRMQLQSQLTTFFFLSPRKTSPSLEFFCSPITFRIYSLDTHAFNVLTHAYKQPSSSLSVCLSRSSRPDLVRQSLSFASLIFSLLCLAFFSPAVVVRFVSPHFFLPPKNATSELHHVWRQKKRRKQMAVLYVRIHKYVAFCSKRGHKWQVFFFSPGGKGDLVQNILPNGYKYPPLSMTLHDIAANIRAGIIRGSFSASFLERSSIYVHAQ